MEKKELTAEQKKRLEEMGALLEKNADRLKKMTTDEEVFAFFEENGYCFTDEEKEIIKKTAKEGYEKELSDDELSQVAGGWGWGFFGIGTVGGGALGLAGSLFLSSNPVGWVILTCGAVGAVGGGIAGGIFGEI
jgi:predicted ribosomally synthesized peptide with nif11-like leader